MSEQRLLKRLLRYAEIAEAERDERPRLRPTDVGLVDIVVEHDEIEAVMPADVRMTLKRCVGTTNRSISFVGVERGVLALERDDRPDRGASERRGPQDNQSALP